MTGAHHATKQALQPRWLHIGFGAFARAHTVAALDRSMAKQRLAGGATPADWGVVVSRLRSGVAQLNALVQTGHQYYVAEIDDSGATLQTVQSIIGTCHPIRDGIDALHDLIASPALSLITLTITEKGYRNGPTMGTLCQGLLQRRQAGNGGLTILSCDNLSENGVLTRQALLAEAIRLDTALADWIASECRFPSSMVDRIVPEMTEASHTKLEELLGKPDPNGIICEPFFQWVIEDNFLGERPPLELAGVQWVDDILPWESMKLRMLNGSHTFLALLGRIAGHRTIDACMADAVFHEAVLHLMLHESAPTLPTLPGANLPGYAQSLIKRFSNSELKHRTEQIAKDTSQKLPQRLLESIAINIEAGRPWAMSALAIAAWGIYLVGLDDQQEPLALSDPLADELASLVTNTDKADLMDALLNVKAVFPPALANNPDFRDAVKASYTSIRTLGARAAIADRLHASV
ncbi:mannitol dehydrogenase family protein [Halomonas sp. MCCC 1A11036]|uniref:Mannitol dehydrogenase family protein n=1 Tax=Billgrantia zhangzhouensis TaxID=2733481 RepID=A0ABS9ACZ8_9GAMM|nr:mannitol dehydrogenase family protein [Halomonas zhangzhouensis]MCE8019481.1 mannitol dehydrogenase family protein [Halomonas zhangzhouensis]